MIKLLNILNEIISEDNHKISLNSSIKELVTDTEVICDNCGWKWKIEDGGNDLYICHKCYYDNNPKNQIKEHEGKEYPSYMYSPIGFGCHVCKYYYIENKKHMCKNKKYQEYKGTAELIDNEGNQIKDPSKWCSNWFMPKEDGND